MSAQDEMFPSLSIVSASLSQVLKERIRVDIVHKHDSVRDIQSRDAPCSFDTFLRDHKQKGYYQGYTYLYLDGIGTLSIEVFQWEVLLGILDLCIIPYGNKKRAYFK